MARDRSKEGGDRQSLRLVAEPPQVVSTSNETPARARGGWVSLVGAGPGDPELLTRKGANRLAEADAVFYDALVNPALLSLAPRARRCFVGKRAGRPSIEQSTIVRMMIDAARRSERVVRLKGGDPFVFGRGGEEAMSLAAADVPFDVIPGVSSAIAAPALAGVPVTHRGISSAFVVLSGHAAATCTPILEGLAPGALTLVVLMGLDRRRAICQQLLRRGWSAETPVAVIYAAGWAQQCSWYGDLARAAQNARLPQPGSAPGTLVIGAVVALAETLAAATSTSFTSANTVTSVTGSLR